MCQHPFEQSGCGVAPFKFVRLEYRVGPIKLGDGTEVGAPGQPMGTCDHCGMGIAYCCIIRDTNGKEFVVGSVCVNKTEQESVMARTVDRKVKLLQKQNQKQRDADRIEAAKATFANIRYRMVDTPHPNEWRASKGDTLADYVEWMFKNAGNAGKIKMARLIEKKAKEINGE